MFAQICVFQIFFVPLHSISENRIFTIKYTMNEKERIDALMKSLKFMYSRELSVI